jgi:branched-chain amino acid transport system substrate-binding protein
MLVRAFIAVSLLLAAPAAAAADEAFTIGIMNDQSGPYADLSGPSSVQAVKMAIEDFGVRAMS